MGSENNNTESINSDSFHNKLDNFFDQIINSSNELEQLKFVCIFLFLSFLFKNIFYYILWISVSIIELKIITDIRNRLYTHTQSFPLSFFDKNKTGEIFSIMMNDVASIRVAFNKSLHVFLHETVSIIILLTLLFSISPKLTLLVILTIPLAGFIILKIGYSIRRKAKRASFKIANLSSIISEKLSGIKIVKAFNMTKKEISNFIEINSQFFQLQYRQNKLVGRKNNKTYKLGDHVKLRIIKVDVLRNQVDLEIITEEKTNNRDNLNEKTYLETVDSQKK